MPKWNASDYGLGYADGQQDADLKRDLQWKLLGTRFYNDTQDGDYWLGYHDGRWNWPDKRTTPEWSKYFTG